MLFLSIFGISFKHKESKVIGLNLSDYTVTGENENTKELKELFAEVSKRQPTVTECKEKKPFADNNRITAVFFDGEKYKGRTTKIFAYIGFPENASADHPVPAMVLVHGGAGHAYADWVKYWVDNGYAAISVDGFGQQPNDGYYKGDGDNDSWTVNPESHPTIDELRSADKPFKEQWFYHYVSDVILSNTIIRNDERVIADKVGITGISWGSIATSVAISYDSRFAFAIPVYGCGFLNHSTAAIGAFCSSQEYIDKWEPSHLIDKVDMPILYVNGDDDPFFSANCNTASAANAKNASVTYVHGMLHGQNPGSRQPEILRFANEQNGIGEGNIKITEVSFDGRRAVVSFTAPEDIDNLKVKVYYRDSELEYNGLEIKKGWSKKSGIVLGDKANVRVPDKATMFYISVEGKTGKLFDKDTVRGTTGIYTTDVLTSAGSYAKDLNAEKLGKKITKTIKKDISDGKVGGAELLVNQYGERVFDGVFGDKIVGKEALEKNAVYRLASMTKPVTAVAMLIEYERGNLDIYADVSDYLDGYTNMYVGKFDENGQVVPDKPAKNSIKVYQCVSHISGIGSGVLGDAVYNGLPAGQRTVQSVAKYLSDKPLEFDPGTSQSYSTAAYDVVAAIIENISGMSYEEYLKVNIFDKLGMNDTTFAPNEEQFNRMIGLHNRTEDGKAVFAESVPNCVMANFPITYHCAGGGLASTAEDYIKFAEMLLNEGVGENGVRILSAESVRLMRTPVVDDTIMPGNQKWGLGVRVICGDNHTLPNGSFGWSGMYGSHFWIDPTNKITAIYMKNSLYDGGAGSKTSIQFEKDVMDSIRKLG
ncbi:MAG: serine hydrolase [Clostridia bacterium]|nr:serine hydrolase [Clostridia bacterium]